MEKTTSKVVKQNIEIPKIDAPKVLSTIQIAPERKKLIKVSRTELIDKKDSPKPKFFGIFKMKDWDRIIKIAVKANREIGKMCITLSKKAFEGGKLNPDYGSIWYTCGTKDFRDNFEYPYTISESTIGLDRISKEHLLNIPVGGKFSIVWINEHCDIEVVECERGIKDYDVFLYSVCSDMESEYEIAIDDIKKDGSGVMDSEDFYFYISGDN